MISSVYVGVCIVLKTGLEETGKMVIQSMVLFRNGVGDDASALKSINQSSVSNSIKIPLGTDVVVSHPGQTHCGLLFWGEGPH